MIFENKAYFFFGFMFVLNEHQNIENRLVCPINIKLLFSATFTKPTNNYKNHWYELKIGERVYKEITKVTINDLNQAFVDTLRKQMLVWRAFPSDVVVEYARRAADYAAARGVARQIFFIRRRE